MPRAHKTCFMFFVHKQTFIRRVGSRAPCDLRATIENELNTIYSTGLAVGDGGSSGGRRVRGVAVSPRLGLAAQNVFYSLTNKTCFYVPFGKWPSDRDWFGFGLSLAGFAWELALGFPFPHALLNVFRHQTHGMGPVGVVDDGTVCDGSDRCTHTVGVTPHMVHPIAAPSSSSCVRRAPIAAGVAFHTRTASQKGMGVRGFRGVQAGGNARGCRGCGE